MEVAKLSPKLQASERIAKFHPLIRQTKPHLAERWNTQGRLSAGNDGLDMRVSRAQLGRACRIMDTLIRTLEQRGALVTIDPQNEWKRPTYASIEGEQVHFGLEESLKIVQMPKDQFGCSRQEFVPNGTLVLRIKSHLLTGCRTKWSDGTRGGLEQKLDSFVKGLWVAAAYLKKDRQGREAQQRQWAKEQQEREQQLQALAEEKGRQQVLEQQALSWQKSRLLRAFIRAAIRTQKTYAANSEFARWVAWANSHADQIDPFKATSLS